MNRMYHITALSFLVASGLSFTMDKPRDPKVRPLELVLLSTANDGKFIDNNQMVLTGMGGTILYNTDTKKEEKICDTVTCRVAKSCGDTIVAYDITECILYDLKNKNLCGVEQSYAHRSVAFNKAGTHLFQYKTGHFIQIGGEGREDISTGKELLSIDCNNYERCTYQIECGDDVSAVGAMTCHPLNDEIAYTSGKNIVSVISIKDGLIEKKGSITVDNILGNVGGVLKYSLDGSHLGIDVCGATKNSGLSLHMYDFEKKEMHDFGAFHGIDFHPNGLIMALLRRNTAVDFIDFRTKEIIASTEQLDEDPLFENCDESITISPDGKSLFVSIPIGRPGRKMKQRGFLIPVPAVVYAYNKAKAERK